LRPREIEEELRRGHGLIFEKLPKRTKTILALPERERKKVIRERKQGLKEGAKPVGSKSAAPAKKRRKSAS
jgi:hypothetical protein